MLQRASCPCKNAVAEAETQRRYSRSAAILYSAGQRRIVWGACVRLRAPVSRAASSLDERGHLPTCARIATQSGETAATAEGDPRDRSGQLILS